MMTKGQSNDHIQLVRLIRSAEKKSRSMKDIDYRYAIVAEILSQQASRLNVLSVNISI